MSENTKEAVDTVNVGNIKTVAEAGSVSVGNLMQGNAQLQQIALQNAISHQNRVNALSESALALAQKQMLTSVSAAAAANDRMVTAGDPVPLLQELGAVVSALQQMVKGAQTTPPETGT